MPRLLKWLTGIVLLAAIGAVGYQLVAPKSETTVASRSSGKGAFKGKRGGAAPGEAVPVLASKAETADVPIYLDGLGTARALNTVTVQPQVDGRLLSIDFKEGQDVKKGDVLARIDPAIYEAQLAQAVAKKGQDEAQLGDARKEFDRVSRVGPIATLQKSVDTAQSKVAQFEALVKADQAAIDLARTQLDYTTIVAPIDGRTGIRMVDVGNIVRAGATAGIVVITQVQPIAVLFNLPQQQLARVNAAMARGNAASEIAADAIAPNGRSVLERGVVRVVDNQVDQSTGTIRLKAEFPNRTLALWPGQFVNVRIEVERLMGATIVPTASVQQGPTGPFVYVVSEDAKARMRPIRISNQDEWTTTIAEGVKAGDQIVTSSFSRLRDDALVTVTLQPMPTAASSDAKPGAPLETGSTELPAAAEKMKARNPDGEMRRGKRREAASDAVSGRGQGAASQ